MIELLLIGQNSRGQERNADERDRDLSDQLCVKPVRNSHAASLTLLQTPVSIGPCAPHDSRRALHCLIACSSRSSAGFGATLSGECKNCCASAKPKSMADVIF